ncbi:polysaccharide deacetylase family protein [Leptothrix sp. BB-4]
MNRVQLGTRLAGIGALGALNLAHDRGRTSIVILAYHRVLPEVDEATHPYDLGLVSATPEEFDWQMALVRREYDPISLSDLGLYLRGRKKLPRRPVIVTFDDGYADNYQHAYPILKKHGIPATVFIATGYIGGDEPFWHDAAPNVVLRAREGVIPTLDGELELRPDDSRAQRRAAGGRLLGYLKRRPHAELMATVRRLREEHAASLRAEDQALVRTMSWDQIREMADGGIEFGSHTVNHALIARLDADELRFELEASRREIENQLQRPCLSIAYPAGRAHAVSQEALVQVALSGYSIGAAYDAGTNWGGAVHPLGLLRQSIERDTTRDYFRAMLALPEWFK